MICPRCGREQPTLASPCPSCGLLDSGAFNPGTTRPPEVVCAIDPHAGAETPESSKRPKRPQPYFCKDCGRRFYNIGWHCEACGSSNYEPVSSGLEPSAGNSGGDASRASSSPVQLAFMHAHRSWAKRFQPWLMVEDEWLT
jgi:ribosomal protein L37E